MEAINRKRFKGPLSSIAKMNFCLDRYIVVEAPGQLCMVKMYQTFEGKCLYHVISLHGGIFPRTEGSYKSYLREEDTFEQDPFKWYCTLIGVQPDPSWNLKNLINGSSPNLCAGDDNYLLRTFYPGISIREDQFTCARTGEIIPPDTMIFRQVYMDEAIAEELREEQEFQ